MRYRSDTVNTDVVNGFQHIFEQDIRFKNACATQPRAFIDYGSILEAIFVIS